MGKGKTVRAIDRHADRDAGEFWPAEDYHQDYYKKNPVRYKFYLAGCGRYARLDQLWGPLRK